MKKVSYEFDLFTKRPTVEFAPGVYPDMDRYTYDRIPALSSTVIKKWLRLQAVPSVFEHWAKNRWEETPSEALLLGNALDTLRLEKGRFHERFICVPPDAPRRPSHSQRHAKKPSSETISAIAWWNKFNEAAAGKQLLTPDQIQSVRCMDQALENAPTANGIFDNCRKVVLIGEVFGQKAKAELDLWNGGEKNHHILDVKTAEDVTEHGFIRAIDRFQYVEQAAWYLLLAQNLGYTKTTFDWVAVGNEAPWPVKVHPFVTTNPKHKDIYEAACLQIKEAVHSLTFVCLEGKFVDDPDWKLVEFPDWYLSRARKQLEAL